MKDLRILYRLYVFLTRGTILRTTPAANTTTEVERLWKQAA